MLAITYGGGAFFPRDSPVSRTELMWTCLDCDESHTDAHVLCWRCGAIRSSSPPTDLPDSTPKTDASGSAPPARIPHFNGRTMFVMTAILGFFYLPWRAAGGSFGSFLLVLVIGNGISALVGLVATAVLPRPDKNGDYC